MIETGPLRMKLYRFRLCCSSLLTQKKCYTLGEAFMFLLRVSECSCFNTQLIKKGTLQRIGMYKNASNAIQNCYSIFIYLHIKQNKNNSLWWASIINIWPELCLKEMSGIFITYTTIYVLLWSWLWCAQLWLVQCLYNGITVHLCNHFNP